LFGGIVAIAILFMTSCAGELGFAEDDTFVERAVEHFNEKSNNKDKACNVYENQEYKEFANCNIDFGDLLGFNASYGVEIQPLGVFHGEDILSNYFLLEWYGLYVDGKESELRQVEVEFHPAFDPLLDMLGEMTAKKGGCDQ